MPTSAPLSRVLVIPYPRAALTAFTLVYAGTALGAYSLGPIPLQWLTQFFLLGVVALMALQNRLLTVPGSGFLALFVAWAALVTLANALLFDYSRLLPELSTSPYWLFIGLRFLSIFAFAAAAALVYWLLSHGFRDDVIARIAWIGAITAAFAIYIYFAQINGWWEPTRTRMGTAGQAQTTEFVYAFHRAQGTFREPSHLAEWLVLPFFTSFMYRGSFAWLPRLAIGCSLLLTGSLTGLVGITAGMLFALFLTNPFRGTNLKVLIQFCLAAAVGLFLFNIIALVRDPASSGLLGILFERIEPILEGGGMSASNRGYIWDYIAQQQIPLFGSGLGNANLRFTQYNGSSTVTSLLSLYFTYAFSVGLPALILLLAMLARPALRIVRRAGTMERDTIMILAAFAAWMVMFAVHAEELGLLFGIVFGLLTHEAWHPGRAVEQADAAAG